MGASVRRVSTRTRTALAFTGGAWGSNRVASARFAVHAIPAVEDVCKKRRRETRLIFTLQGLIVALSSPVQAGSGNVWPQLVRRRIYDYRPPGTRRGNQSPGKPTDIHSHLIFRYPSHANSHTSRSLACASCPSPSFSGVLRFHISPVGRSRPRSLFPPSAPPRLPL